MSRLCFGGGTHCYCAHSTKRPYPTMVFATVIFFRWLVRLFYKMSESEKTPGVRRLLLLWPYSNSEHFLKILLLGTKSGPFYQGCATTPVTAGEEPTPRQPKGERHERTIHLNMLLLKLQCRANLELISDGTVATASDSSSSEFSWR